MNIVYLVPYLANTGPINVLYNIVKNINREKYVPIIISLDKNDKYKDNNRYLFDKLGIEIIEYNYSHWYLQFHISIIAKDICKRFYKSDVLFHAHGYYPTLILSRMKHVKTITTIHNICVQDFVMSKGFVLGHYMSYMYKKALKKIDRSVAISNFMKSYYEKDKSLNLDVIYNGVSSFNGYTEKEKSEIKKKHNIPTQAKVLLYPACICYRKNQKNLINSLKQSSRQDFVVLFAGNGPVEAECKALAGNDSRFRFLGFQMDLSSYWAIADFMISASKSEGMPMAVLEALIQGIPCLLSDIPPHVEIQQNIYGEEDFLFSITDSNDLLFKFDSFLDCEIDHEFIKERARCLYSSEVMARQYMDLYASMI